MANQRGTFSKRNREMKLKDRQRDKAERLAARRAGNRDNKGPEIAWDQAGGVGSLASEAEAPAPASAPAEPAPDPAAAAPQSNSMAGRVSVSRK
jgi:hypothetical protein